jgi:hypothetical protein
MKKFLIALAFLFPGFASAAPYALELSAPCAASWPDGYGGAQQGIEPAGYVADIVIWDGVTRFAPLDPCGNAYNLVAEPTLGTPGITFTPTPTETLAADQAEYTRLIAGGVTITSTATPALNGTYGASATDQSNYTSTETAVQAGIATFPMIWIQQSGAAVSIPSAAVFLEIAGAVYKFVNAADLAEATAAAGGTPTWPSPNVTVP